MPTRELLLQPKQLEIGKLFYRTGPDAATWIGGGGARAGGKSGGLRRIMLDRRIQRPGTPGVIIRRVWEELRFNHVEKYLIECPELRDCWQEGKHRFALGNGSTINFMYAENQQEVDRKFWGPEFYDIMIDQAEQFSEYELGIINTSNRWGTTPLGECKTGLFFNPGGVGTEFLRRVFSQKRFNGNERASNFAFVHLFGWDNYVWFEGTGLNPKQFYALPGLCKDKEGSDDSMCCRFHLFINRTSEGRKLNALPPSLRAGHLLGSFDSFAGQYFAGVWDESKLILTRDQETSLIQSWWYRWMAQDHGFVHHTVVGWAASGRVSPKQFGDVFGVQIPFAVDVVVIYRCYSAQETEEGEMTRLCIRQMGESEKKFIKRYFVGWSSDVVSKGSYDHSPMDTINMELRRANLPFLEDADDGRVGGWRFLYAMMKKTADVLGGAMNPTRENEDYDDEAGGYSLKTPLLFISPDCVDVIEAIPMLVRDTKHPGKAEDVLKMPTKADDVGDMVRYLCKSALNPRSAAPLAVQRQEFFESMPAKDLTSKSIHLQKWDLDHRPGRKSAWASRQ